MYQVAGYDRKESDPKRQYQSEKNGLDTRNDPIDFNTNDAGAAFSLRKGWIAAAA